MQSLLRDRRGRRSTMRRMEGSPANTLAEATGRIAAIVGAAEAAAERIRTDAEAKARARIAEAQRAADNRVAAAEAEAKELQETAERETQEARAQAESSALEMMARAQEEADATRQQAMAQAAEERASAEDEVRDMVREAREAANEVLTEGMELSSDLRELSDSLRSNAELLLRDVRAAHARMTAGLDRAEAPASARSGGERERLPRDRPAAELDVPEFVPPR